MLTQDLHYGLRQLWKSPGFALTVVFTLALGIGANTAIFSLFNALVLRPVSAQDPASVVNVYRTAENEDRFGVFSYPEYRSYRAGNTVLSGLAAFTGAQVTLTGGGENPAARDLGETLQAQLVSGNYFSVLGVGASAGRMFIAEEDQAPNAPAVVVLSYDLWQRRFQSDPNIVGSTLKLNAVSYTVVGVAPRGFGGTVPDPPDVWMPLMMLAQVRPGANLLEDRDYMSLQLVGRLKAGVRRQEAQAELTVLAQQFAQAGASAAEKNHKVNVTVTAGEFLNPQERSGVLPLAVLVMAAAGLVLLIACANVGNLMLARGASRQKRSASGSRWARVAGGWYGNYLRRACCCRWRRALAECFWRDGSRMCCWRQCIRRACTGWRWM